MICPQANVFGWTRPQSWADVDSRLRAILDARTRELAILGPEPRWWQPLAWLYWKRRRTEIVEDAIQLLRVHVEPWMDVVRRAARGAAMRLTDAERRVLEALVDGERYGRELKAELGRRARMIFWTLAVRLEDAALVESSPSLARAGERMYRITLKGKAHLAAEARR